MSTTDELQQEISKLNMRLFKAEVRIEALTRLLYGKNTISVDEYQAAINGFQAMNNAVAQISNISSIMDKVNAAAKFNETATIKVTADDLGIRKIIEDAGGTSDFTARIILAKLPMSENFGVFIKQFLDPTKNTSGAIYPDQVYSEPSNN